MNIFFDMDFTLLGMDNTLRPGVREVMLRLKDDGHVLYVWSGTGIRWREVRQHGLESLITDCFTKPLSNYAEAMEEQGLPVLPDLVIDDHLEVPTALGGIWMRQYLYHSNLHDDEMERVYRIITEYVRNGRSEDVRFLSKPEK
ncbi:MAG: hypothetical protein V3S37_04450 [Dehalococcoidia bacterium]